MKIRPLTPDLLAKAGSLVHHAFAPSRYELRLFDRLHEKNRPLHEWVCLHRQAVIACICFSRAFHGKKVCGLHLALLAVQPRQQGQGIGSELLRFALRQAAIATQPIYVLGDPAYFHKFGFVPCAAPICPLVRGNKHFLGLRNSIIEPITIGYEPEFYR
ncbi:GNAT family N-acetyltransferase [Desulfobulbus propionicus]|jgi:putative acetyltransferase